MKMLRTVVMVTAIWLMLTALSHAALTNLIINGSFETPDIAPGAPGPLGGWAIYYSPILGWTPATGNGLEIQDHVEGIWEAYHGDQLAELDVEGNSGIYQTVNTTSGQLYNFSFALSPRPGLASSSSGIQLYWNDGLVDTLSPDGVDLTNTAWLINNYIFAATGTSSSIKFMATGTSDGMGGLIDHVQLTPVPIPSSFILMGSGLVGLVGFRRKFKK